MLQADNILIFSVTVCLSEVLDEFAYNQHADQTM